MAKFLTAPVPTKQMPRGIPYIVGNEAAERFSFYGMKAILFVFMTQYLVTSTGGDANLTETQAREWQALFSSAAYATPVLGALLADALWGKYKTILYVSLLYCVGHGTLALMDLPPALLQQTFEPKTLLIVGLGLIAFGSGGIKPCVSAHVGDQFGESNKHLLSKVFSWFYFSINFGSVLSTLATPWLLEEFGPAWAFGVPGILMAIATFVFWLGRTKFVHIPSRGAPFIKELFSPTGWGTIAKLLPIYFFVAIFWSCYDQSASAWVGQAGRMDRTFLGLELLQSQVQAVNPLLILIFIPLFAYVVYPALDRIWRLTALRKIGIGLFLTAGSFAAAAVIEQWTVDAQTEFDAAHRERIEAGEADVAATLDHLHRDGRPRAAEGLLQDFYGRETVDAWIADVPSDVSLSAYLDRLVSEVDDGSVADRARATPDAFLRAGAVVYDDSAPEPIDKPNIAWQMLAFVCLTAGEVMVSITALEFAYTQAPTKLKSLIMCLYLGSVTAGNLIIAAVNRFTQDAEGNTTLVGASYYWFFTWLMLGASVVYIVVALLYKPKEYLQEEGISMEAAVDEIEW